MIILKCELLDLRRQDYGKSPAQDSVLRPVAEFQPFQYIHLKHRESKSAFELVVQALSTQHKLKISTVFINQRAQVYLRCDEPVAMSHLHIEAISFTFRDRLSASSRALARVFVIFLIYVGKCISASDIVTCITQKQCNRRIETRTSNFTKIET
jgi:hypothetical protein